MKAIILAGGSGTRMYPLTKVLNKHLLPVYNKPIIYYPLAMIMKMGIKDIIIISSPEFIDNYKKIFSDGVWLGINITYLVQHAPEGIAQSFLIAEDYIKDENVCLILGDNIFYSEDFTILEEKVNSFKTGALICAYQVDNPSRYGVLELNEQGKVIGIEEKPAVPKSNYIVSGLYFYDKDVVRHAKSLKPSYRNELEITDLNNIYLHQGQIDVFTMEQNNYQWFDTGTYDSILEASQRVKNYEERGLYIACIEEIALRQGFINFSSFKDIISAIKGNSDYKQYLIKLMTEYSEKK